MTNSLTLIKSDKFGETECDIYSDNKEMYMTLSQLSNCLGYASKDSIKSLLGKLANQNGLKTDEYGVVAMDKSPYSSKEIPSFRYNSKGVEKLKALAKCYYLE